MSFFIFRMERACLYAVYSRLHQEDPFSVHTVTVMCEYLQSLICFPHCVHLHGNKTKLY